MRYFCFSDSTQQLGKFHTWGTRWSEAFYHRLLSKMLVVAPQRTVD